MAAVLIVGASLAGLRTAEGLRSAGFDGTITVIGEEPGPPCDRPPLSKQFLAGSWDVGRIALRVPDDVELRTGVRAVSLDAQHRSVRASDGSTFVADAVVVATGARPRNLTAPSVSPSSQTVHVLRTVADSAALRESLLPGADVVVIGAGFIGSEVAATASGLGCRVHVVEALPVPYGRALGEEMGRHCASLHARHGVELSCGVAVRTVAADHVELEDGRRLPADVVVAGIGVAPNTDWMEGSGLDIGNGVRCDDQLRALTDEGVPAAGIWAAGDVASWPNALFPGADGGPERMRVEHWTTAAEMGEHVGQAVSAWLSGRPGPDPFAPVPYFWSDQYGMKIQFLGRGNDADEVLVVDGPDEEGRLLALYRRGERLSGVLGISRMRALMGYRALLADAASWSEALAAAGR